MDSPIITHRSGRHGHDQNKAKLQRDITMGYSQFGPIVETIRLLNLDNNLTGRLIFDFKKFRDIMAHKGVDDVIFHQMVVAFVKYCRGILKLQPVTYEPASTTAMSTSFARMADINVVTCATWFMYLPQRDRAHRKNIARWMTKQVENSSFSQFTFSVDEESEEILVTSGGTTLRNTSFDTDWLDELTTLVQNLSVTYDPDEIKEFTDCYQIANELM